MSALETAIDPSELRRIAIDPVSRVEGHGKVTLLLDNNNRVHQARLHIVEFRGFEAFIEGRPYWEAPVIVQRLCGICPVSHHIAAAKAMDIIAGYGALTPTAEKLRRLLHYGQLIQSHALHFFHLASPDLLLGFESEVAKRNIIGVAAAFPELARMGVMTRKFGQEVIRHIVGKRIHGTGCIPGGMNKALKQEERDALRSEIDQIVSWSREAIALVRRLHETDTVFYAGFGESRANMMGLVDNSGALDFYHGGLRARNADGGPIFDHVDYSTYRELLREEVKPWSYMKFPHIRKLGAEAGWYRVGPLARVQVADFLASELAEAERKNFLAAGGGKVLHGALFFHWARMIEMLHAAELARDLLDDPEIRGTDLVADKGPRREEGIGVIEAPRGTLFHHYKVNEDDIITYCNLIVSTTNNNQAMNESIRSVAAKFFDGRAVTEGLLNHIEIAIRAYDPCLSCATHALGQMPLQIEILDAKGALVSQASKG
jgi:NAD-reducing hydrogenase large subunit